MTTPLHVMIRFGKWNDILAEPEPPEWRLFSRAERHFARSVAYSALGKTVEAQQEIDLLDRSRRRHNRRVGDGQQLGPGSTCRRPQDGCWGTGLSQGGSRAGFALLREAVEMEEALSYDEPPGWMQPVRHALGALLLAEEHLAEAEEVYRADLERHPNNSWSLLGLQQALHEQGELDEAESLERKGQGGMEACGRVPGCELLLSS